MPRIEIHLGDNLEILPRFPDASFALVYIDPPFNTGKPQRQTRTRSVRDANGAHKGFHGARYTSVALGSRSFADSFDDYLAFLEPRLVHARRLLTPHGSLFVHLDCREVHYVKVLLDQLFGRDSFQNEIVWAYDYGARSKSRWPRKHDNILWYTKHPTKFTFDYAAIDRIPYLAPDLVSPAKAARGKTPTDTWWHTIVSPTGREKTGYPAQKPLAILERIVRVHSRPGERLLDFFAGSGTLGEAAARHGRAAVLVDSNPEALAIMRARLAFAAPLVHGGVQDKRRVERSALLSGVGARRGRSTRKRAPPRGDSPTSIEPACSSTAMRAKARPRP
jgi:site-specific DNA-methyltransferase (adenine-specific)